MTSHKIIGKASRPQVREKRREIILEIIMSAPTVKWTVRKIAEEARAHPWFAEHQPNYGKSTAHLDLAYAMQEIKERRQELAQDFIVEQLDVSSDLMADLLQEYENLNSIDIHEIPDPIERANFVISSIKAKKDLVASIDRLMSRQANLVPINVPKQVNIDQRSISMNLDTFQKIQGQVEAQKQALLQETIKQELSESDDYEDGEFEDIED